MERTYYDVLGIEPGAKPKKIKAAFRRLAKRYHPDTNRGDPAGEKRFQEILEAYRHLSSPEKRALYDADLARREQAPQEPRPGFIDRVRAFLRALSLILSPPERPSPADGPASNRPAGKAKRAERRPPSQSFEEVLAAARENQSVYRMCEDGVIRKAARPTASARQADCRPGMSRRYGVVGVLILFLSTWWETLTR